MFLLRRGAEVVHVNLNILSVLIGGLYTIKTLMAIYTSDFNFEKCCLNSTV